uniref:Immunoglobulin V-set domain-containing protein n=1 Tax=Xiphophorus couchianus TaxID=32473 RepID=A0A3B5KV30_9TELE
MGTLICFMDLFPVCSDKLKIEVKTVTAGQNVTLNCPRQTSALYRETFYWIRLVSGNWPEFLGPTYGPEFLGSRLTATYTEKISNLTIVKTTEGDEGILLNLNSSLIYF